MCELHKHVVQCLSAGSSRVKPLTILRKLRRTLLTVVTQYYLHPSLCWWFWLSGNVVGHINEVTLRRAGLVLRWVTIHGYTVSVFNEATQANSAWSSLRG